jgi:hypothetical protein
MRKRIGIGVVAAALLFGLIGPGVSSGAAAGHDQVMTAGIGTDVTEVFRALGRTIRALLPFIEHDGPELEAAVRELQALVHARLGEVEVTDRQLWKLVDVACTAKDVPDAVRQRDVEEGVGMLASELPDPIGTVASVYGLANDLAEAKTSDERATVQFCARAAQAAEG